MKNTMADLHDRMMGQIDLLCDEDLEGEALDRAVKRASAVTSVAKVMIDNAKVVLDAERFRHKHKPMMGEAPALPAMLTARTNGDA